MTREPTQKEIDVAKALCVADGVDPDKTGHGMGRAMPKDWSGPVWQARIPQARAAIRAMPPFSLSDSALEGLVRVAGVYFRSPLSAQEARDLLKADIRAAIDAASPEVK